MKNHYVSRRSTFSELLHHFHYICRSSCAVSTEQLRYYPRVDKPRVIAESWGGTPELHLPGKKTLRRGSSESWRACGSLQIKEGDGDYKFTGFYPFCLLLRAVLASFLLQILIFSSLFLLQFSSEHFIREQPTSPPPRFRCLWPRRLPQTHCNKCRDLWVYYVLTAQVYSQLRRFSKYILGRQSVNQIGLCVLTHFLEYKKEKNHYKIVYNMLMNCC